MSNTTTLLAQALFASPLQASAHPSDSQVRTAIDVQLHRHSAEFFPALIAQEAGDHPEMFHARMTWALEAVSSAYTLAAA